MNYIENIKQINKYNSDGRAILIITSFELWKEIYKQIVMSKNIRKENQSYWQRDWERGEEYLKEEFDLNSDDNDRIYLSLRRNSIERKIGVAFCGCVPLIEKDKVMYMLVNNKYSVDLI